MRRQTKGGIDMKAVALGGGRHIVGIKYREAIGFVICHSVAVLALFPWFFSWTGFIVFNLGTFLFGVVGLNLTYHRLVSHRAFKCRRWLECTLAVIGACSMEFSPAHWAAVHRRHHHHTDDDFDPHSPVRSFMWAHMGWLVAKVDDMNRRELLERYAKDLMRDPLYAWLERRDHWLRIGLALWLAYFVVGFAAARVSGSSSAASVQFGLSLLVWGAALRTVVVWHSSWAINSVSHIWGYRNYDTPDRSRNNLFASLLVGGEWHNNHHADPASARQGHKWWEIDVTWLIIRGFERLGLATDVVTPSPAVVGPVKSQTAGHDVAVALSGSE
jgi:stearoyl-CoA desaturase (delta-9 desaturase)